jgi:hypothetical protein
MKQHEQMPVSCKLNGQRQGAWLRHWSALWSKFIHTEIRRTLTDSEPFDRVLFDRQICLAFTEISVLRNRLPNLAVWIAVTYLHGGMHTFAAVHTASQRIWCTSARGNRSVIGHRVGL